MSAFESKPIEHPLIALMKSLGLEEASISADGDDADHPLINALKKRKRRVPFSPASAEIVKKFLMGPTTFEVGDIVTLRTDLASNDSWPTLGQECIVSQVLDAPIRHGDAGTSNAAARVNIALVFVAAKDVDIDSILNPGAVNSKTPEVFEFMYDSRRFTKIGSIFSND